MYGTDELNQILVFKESHKAIEPDAVYDSVEEATFLEEKLRLEEKRREIIEGLEEAVEKLKALFDEMADAITNVVDNIVDLAKEDAESVLIDDDEPFDIVKIIKMIGRKVKHYTVTRLLIPP